MADAIRDLNLLLQTLEPKLNSGVYAYCSLALDADLSAVMPLAIFRETEGLTVVIEESAALTANFTVLFRAAWITLTVKSDLQAIGLTAAFANALGAASISCNVIAATHHDHIFVPIEDAQAAMAVLIKLQEAAWAPE